MLDVDLGLEIALLAGNVVEATPVQGVIRPLPGSVPFVEGIMQLRDKFVPIVNLKKRFGLGQTGYSGEPKIAVVQLYDQLLGLMVDDIREVFRAEPEAISPVNPILQGGDKVISAIIQLEKGKRTAELLDLKNLFSKGMDDLEQSGVADQTALPRKEITWSRFVVFRCCGQEYGVPVKYAQEITFLTDIDEMFRSGLLEGALNLRGRTVPVMNAAHLLAPDKEAEAQNLEDCRILVMASEECCFGLIVEDVREILSVDNDEILAMPQGQESNLTGIYQRPSGSDVLLLDMPSLVCAQIDDLKSMSRLKNGTEVGATQLRQPSATTHHLITENCYLIFNVDKHFAIELKDVREIIENRRLLNIPGNGGFRSGVINLRGEIVPVINLRKFYNFSDATNGRDQGSRLIICREHDRTVALEVDSIVTIYKQEKYYSTPSLHPKMAPRADTLDRLIEFEGSDSTIEHVLVVNIYNLIRNHMGIADDHETNSKKQ